MNVRLKHTLSRAGLFRILDSVRRLPQALRWISQGCVGSAPPLIKRAIIKFYLKRYQLREFIETGTHLGDTVADVANDCSVLYHSIELDQHLYRQAHNRFRNWQNVKTYQGDSGEVLPQNLTRLHGPALFWLDGHYSGGVTAKGEADTPISIKLQAILESGIKGHVVLIDDARCFDGTSDYPFIEDVLAIVRRNANYRIEASADIIRLTPGTT